MDTNQKLANSIQEMPAATLSRDPGLADVIGARRNWTWLPIILCTPRPGRVSADLPWAIRDTSNPYASWRDLIEDFCR
jgi:hypothetical protein